MSEIDKTIDDLLTRLDTSITDKGRGDAIDQILAASPRTTGVASLAEHDAVAQFRSELKDGFVRVDTARRLLTLIQVAVEVALT